MISKLKKLLTISPSDEDVVDNGLKRKLAVLIIINNNRYIIGLGMLLTFVFVLSGAGEGLDLHFIGVKIRPISETAIALLSSTSGYLLKAWQDEKQLILSYYFFNHKTEDQIESKEESEKNYDLHKNPLTTK
jgi:hypothetical protein